MAQDKLEKALEIFGEEYINEIGNILKGLDKVASGDLLKSLSTKVLKTGLGTSFTLKILATDYLKYVDEGRRPGSKAPPIEPIKKWARLKGLDEGLAYPIAKSIGEEGIKPTHVIDKALKKVLNNAKFRKLEDGAEDWVDELITKRFKGLSRNKNITFK